MADLSVAMQMAIEEGWKGAGFVSPNPLVGCVILNKNLELIGKGYHARLGEGHAEVNALAAVRARFGDEKFREALVGAHVFVTLEPCAHQGRTPSCAKALAQLPLASVTFGLVDPDPRVSGQGMEILKAAGFVVKQAPEFFEDLEELAEIFLLNKRSHRPFVALKVASTRDGKIAKLDGSSQWITGEESRAHVHYLRGMYDAVVAGLGTYLKDNPRLNSRDVRFASKPQKVILLDPKGESFKTLPQSALFSARKPENIFVVTGPDVTVAPPTHVEHLKISFLPKQNSQLDLLLLMQELQARGIYSLFIEGGAYTYASFFNQGLVDRLYLFVAPKFFGQGLSWLSAVEHKVVSQIALEDMESARLLPSTRVLNFGEDILVSCRIR